MNALFYIGPKGGEVVYLSEDGEIRRTLVLGAGAYATASFEKLRRPGETVSYSAPLHGLRASVQRIAHPGAFDSAANPSFRVSPAQRQAKQMQQMLARSEALNRRAAKALQAVKRANRDVPKIEHQRDGGQVQSDAGEISAT